MIKLQEVHDIVKYYNTKTKGMNINTELRTVEDFNLFGIEFQFDYSSGLIIFVNPEKYSKLNYPSEFNCIEIFNNFIQDETIKPVTDKLEKLFIDNSSTSLFSQRQHFQKEKDIIIFLRDKEVIEIENIPLKDGRIIDDNWYIRNPNFVNK